MAPAIVVAAVMAAGTALSAYGQYRQGQQAEAAGEFNAKIAERDALQQEQKAEYEAEASSRKFKALLGRQRALYAKAGVDITSGSPLLVMASQAEEAERERQAIAYGGNIAASQERNRASMFRFQGKQAATAGKIAAATTLLSSLADTGTRRAYYSSPDYKRVKG